MAFLNGSKQEGTGFGIIFATAITCSFVYLWPICAEYWWTTMSSVILKYGLTISQFYLFWNVFQGLLISIITHLIYAICYYGEFDFIEKYKNFDEPWPWQTDNA